MRCGHGRGGVLVVAALLAMLPATPAVGAPPRSAEQRCLDLPRKKDQRCPHDKLTLTFPDRGPRGTPVRLMLEVTGPPQLVSEDRANDSAAVPPGRSVINIPAKITNVDRKLALVNLLDEGVGGRNALSGEIDLPAPAYHKALGELDEGGSGQILDYPAFSCQLTDLTINGDCELAIAGGVDGDVTGLAPGQSAPVTLYNETTVAKDQSMAAARRAGDETGSTLTLPSDIDLTGARIFIRPPRDEEELNLHPCGDPGATGKTTPVGLIGFAVRAEGRHCEPSLTLELGYPGQHDVTPVDTRPGAAPMFDCRIEGADADSKSGVTFLSIHSGEETDIEHSYRSDKLYHVTARSAREAGLRVRFGTEAEAGGKSGKGAGGTKGAVGADIEAGGDYRFGDTQELVFDNTAQAEEIDRLYKGDLAKSPAAELDAEKLAANAVVNSSADSGVDLYFNFAGTPGQIRASAEFPHKLIRYADGSFGVESAIDIEGSGSAALKGSPLGVGLGANAISGTELDLNDQDEPLRLATETTVGVSGGLNLAREQHVPLKGTKVKPNGTQEEARLLGDIEGSLDATTGREVTAASELDLTDPARNGIGRRLVAELMAGSPDLSSEVGIAAKSASDQSTDSVVLSRMDDLGGQEFKVGAGDGIAFDLEYAKSDTEFRALYAVQRRPGEPVERWTDCGT